MTSTEKLNARAKAIDCQSDSYLNIAMNIITKQNRLAITVNAFFSDIYFFMIRLRLFICGKFKLTHYNIRFCFDDQGIFVD
jgi:predicted nuclease of restriction endonuclease-like (RecB) superfamily